MIYNDLIRQLLLGATSLIFLFFAIWALVRPSSLANLLGYTLSTPNGESEFGAIYVGVFVGQFLLCILAFIRLYDTTIGDLVAVFLLLQPVGRLFPLLKHGPPVGFLRILFVLEIIGGLCLLAVRPVI